MPTMVSQGGFRCDHAAVRPLIGSKSDPPSDRIAVAQEQIDESLIDDDVRVAGVPSRQVNERPRSTGRPSVSK